MFPTFLIGALSLLVWLFATGADRTAMRLLGKGVVYFVLAPLLLIPFGLIAHGLGLSHSATWSLFGIILIGPLIEEGLKLWASRSEPEGTHAFALVALFGVMELMLSKPMVIPNAPEKLLTLMSSMEAIPALFMHLLTAAIYGFHWRARRDRQYIVCVGIHGSWNAIAAVVSRPEVPNWIVLIALPVFALAIFFAGPRKMAEWRRGWRSVPAN